MSNIAITHAPSGLVLAEVVSARRLSPHFVRVTLGGDDLDRWDHQGFDQWFRLALPVDDDEPLSRMPDRLDRRGYLSYLTLAKSTRPVIRSYTVAEFRPETRELDVDFVIHGSEGVAGPWAQSLLDGTVDSQRRAVALIDQGCGFRTELSDIADWHLLVGDVTAVPAIAGVLRDLARDARGHAIVTVPDTLDTRDLDAPEGVTVQWIVEADEATASASVLDAVREVEISGRTPYVFAAGESGLVTGARRVLAGERGISKRAITFCGYWKAPRHPAR